ncbi:MAG: DNA repair protein RadA [Saprospiraceae bacterium]|uniref:DNA repair protein RadA n=1 Tax=Candidatus Opimibacter skivensis TaxID=2982028 RepID=A0A9D7SZI7_9BACT|nr:DNA repair protein RadA [Candidatus Opimibacter skivensis]
MSKIKTRFVCNNCGATSSNRLGRCPQCNEWDTFTEEIIQSATPQSVRLAEKEKSIPTLLSELNIENEMRVALGDSELERVLGGGIVPGSLILMAGEPGAGKSTLCLQLAANPSLRILYISGEESASQIKMRAQRLNIKGDNCHILAETDLNKIIEAIIDIQSGIVIIDSVQTMYSPELESVPGSVSQIRECSYRLQQLAKQTGITIIMVGHITKEGDIAGPKLMEHIVDVVLHLEGDRQYHLRLLRCIKNRFGSTREIGIYEMKGLGLVPVENPSEWLIPADHIQGTSGSCIALVCEGFRPFLIETQALVSTAVYGTAQRSTTGYDIRRLHLMLAVLEKRCGFFFGNQDVFLNVAGGLKVNEPAIDLALAVALVSSLQDIPVPRDVCFAGEVGLSGEIRPVQQVDLRVAEAKRLGYKKIYIPAGSQLEKSSKNSSVIEVRLLRELFEEVFG